MSSSGGWTIRSSCRARPRKAIGDRKNTVYVSAAVVAWEIAIKLAFGKLASRVTSKQPWWPIASFPCPSRSRTPWPSKRCRGTIAIYSTAR